MSAFGHNRTGTTLVEVAIAISIVTVSIASLMNLAGQSRRLVSDMRSEIRALNAAGSEMERLRALDWRQLTGRPESSVVEPAGNPDFAGLKDGRGEVRIARLPGDAAGEGMRSATVLIAWTGYDRRRHMVTLTSLMTDRGIEP